jgi:hypothetical protein
LKSSSAALSSEPANSRTTSPVAGSLIRSTTSVEAIGVAVSVDAACSDSLMPSFQQFLSSMAST